MQKIESFLWFDNQAEEAANFYVSIFSRGNKSASTKNNSKITNVTQYSEEGAKAARREPGSVMIVNFELAGHHFIVLNGGPLFKFSRSFSFFVSCRSEEEINFLWKNLSEGGIIRMELDKYPFSEKFGWVEDKFGVSWQLNLVPDGWLNAGWVQKITPFLWFGNKAEEAMYFYTSVFSSIDGSDDEIKDSEIIKLQRFGVDEKEPVGTVKHATFSLKGQNFMAMDNSPEPFTLAQSLLVNCETQDEVDILWEKLSEGGKKDQCGWLKDKYGVSWQIVPTALSKFMSGSNPEKSRRVMKAVLQMTKIEIEELQKAFEQE
jgi:predicted 3-demethylubiquinone-9 3-methyltransferase (glyoxalase superfamily)